MQLLTDEFNGKSSSDEEKMFEMQRISMFEHKLFYGIPYLSFHTQMQTL